MKDIKIPNFGLSGIILLNNESYKLEDKPLMRIENISEYCYVICYDNNERYYFRVRTSIYIPMKSFRVIGEAICYF